MNALQKRMAGLPAWAWIAIIGGGLTVGLILRYRRNSQTQEVADTPADPGTYENDYLAGQDYSYAESGPAGYEITPAAGGGYFQMPVLPSPVNHIQISVGGSINGGGGGGISCSEKRPPLTKSMKRNKVKWKCCCGKWTKVKEGKTCKPCAPTSNTTTPGNTTPAPAPTATPSSDHASLMVMAAGGPPDRYAVHGVV